MRAPADGYVTLVTLTVGDRALQARSIMSFVVENEITIVGMFSQNGFQTIKVGAPVDIVFDNAPGRIWVNTLYAALVAHPRITEVDFSNLRLSGGGGAAVISATSERWRQITGQIIREGYGLSETSPVLSFNPMRLTVHSDDRLAGAIDGHQTSGR